MLNRRESKGYVKISAVLATVGMCVFPARVGRTALFCPVLDDVNVVVGEAKAVWGASGSYYANAYADGGDEINIPGSGLIIGKLSSVSQVFSTSVGAWIQESRTDSCQTLTIEYELRWDNTVPLGCSGGDGGTTATYSVLTCNSPFLTGDVYQGSRELFIGGLGGSSHRFNVLVRAKEGSTTKNSDLDGCFHVENNSGCTGI